MEPHQRGARRRTRAPPSSGERSASAWSLPSVLVPIHLTALAHCSVAGVVDEDCSTSTRRMAPAAAAAAAAYGGGDCSDSGRSSSSSGHRRRRVVRARPEAASAGAATASSVTDEAHGQQQQRRQQPPQWRSTAAAATVAVAAVAAATTAVAPSQVCASEPRTGTAAQHQLGGTTDDETSLCVITARLGFGPRKCCL